jgi:hypothetical protein
MIGMWLLALVESRRRRRPLIVRILDAWLEQAGIGVIEETKD